MWRIDAAVKAALAAMCEADHMPIASGRAECPAAWSSIPDQTVSRKSGTSVRSVRSNVFLSVAMMCLVGYVVPPAKVWPPLFAPVGRIGAMSGLSGVSFPEFGGADVCYRREETGEVGTVFKSQFAGDLLYVCPGVCEHPLGADDDFIPYVPCCAQSGRRPYGFVQVGGRYVHPFGIEGRASADVHELFEQRFEFECQPDHPRVGGSQPGAVLQHSGDDGDHRPREVPDYRPLRFIGRCRIHSLLQQRMQSGQFVALWFLQRYGFRVEGISFEDEPGCLVHEYRIDRKHVTLQPLCQKKRVDLFGKEYHDGSLWAAELPNVDFEPARSLFDNPEDEVFVPVCVVDQVLRLFGPGLLQCETVIRQEGGFFETYKRYFISF